MFETRLRQAADATDTALDRLLSGETRPAEIARPPRLLDAMRYAALGPGQRIRPFLVIETARLFGHAGDAVVTVAAALECIHAYSLVHDDLPAMDDDDMRRGRPTLHIHAGEAMAILAGGRRTRMFCHALSPSTARARRRSGRPGETAP